MSLTIPANDHGRLYVFDISPELAQKPSQLAGLFGLSEINPDYIDVVTLADLSDRGIGWYLDAGYGVTLNAQEAATLNGRDGMLLMLMSRAFGGQAATLDVPAGLQHLSTVDLPGMDMAAAPLTSAAAEGVVSPTEVEMDEDDRPPSRLWIYLMIVVFGFFALMAWRMTTGNV